METENSRLRKGRTLKTPVANKLAQLRPQPYEEVCGVNNHAISYRLDPPRLQEPSPLASLRPSVTQKQDKWQSGDPFLTQGNLSHSCTNTNCAASDQMHKITTPKSLLATCVGARHQTRDRDWDTGQAKGKENTGRPRRLAGRYRRWGHAPAHQCLHIAEEMAVHCPLPVCSSVARSCPPCVSAPGIRSTCSGRTYADMPLASAREPGSC
jgi:hypothetical protein